MKNYFFPHNIKQFFIVILLSAIIEAPFVLLRTKVSEELFMLILFIVFCVAFAAIVLIVNKKLKNKVWNYYECTISKYILLLVLITIIFSVFVNVPIGKFVLKLMQPTYTNNINPTASVVFVISSIIVAPIAEELIFRGILLRSLLYKYTPKISILISAIIFCIVHINPVQLFGAFCLGLLFGFVFYKTKSLLNTIILHATANLSILFADWLNFKFGIIENYKMYVLFALALSLLVLYFAIKYLYRKLQLND